MADSKRTKKPKKKTLNDLSDRNLLAEELYKYYEPIEPYYFYREIFGDGELDDDGAMTKGKYTAIALEITDQIRKKKVVKNGVEIEKDKVVVYRHTVTDDLDMVDQLQYSKHFCAMAPISYAGKTRKSTNARMMFALGVEIDGLRVKQYKDGTIRQTGLETLMDKYSEEDGRIPKPTFIVASGNGLHLYYQFESPLVLFPNTIDSLKRYKEQLTRMLWTQAVTVLYSKDDIQQESIFQPFRMPGTLTRKGGKAIAFRVGEKVSLEYMNSFMYTHLKGKCDIEGTYRSKLLLKDAKELYPEWHEKVIVNGDHSLKEWAVNRAVYDWWLRRIKEDATDGHRFYCLKMLAIYAIKCSNYDPKKNPNPVTEEEFETDLWSLFDDFKARGKRADNPFTEYDMLCAAQVYEDRGFITYPRNSIANRSGIEIIPSVPRREKGKRMKQKAHLKTARMALEIRNEEAGTTLQGRPKGSGTAEEKIKKYRAEHPEAKKADCIRDTGLSKPTVYKWWDGEPKVKAIEKPKKSTKPELIREDVAVAGFNPVNSDSVENSEVKQEILKMLLNMSDEERAAFWKSIEEEANKTQED